VRNLDLMNKGLRHILPKIFSTVIAGEKLRLDE